MPPTLIEFILRDWCKRVIEELDAKKIAPAPWNIRQALGWANAQLLKLAGESVSREDEG